MSYQYIYSIFYCNIHLLRFDFCYCTSIYKKYVILLCFICNYHNTLLILKIFITKKNYLNFLNQFLSDIFKRHFCYRQQNQPPSNIFDHPEAAKIERRPHRENIERRRSIRDQTIVVR